MTGPKGCAIVGRPVCAGLIIAIGRFHHAHHDRRPGSHALVVPGGGARHLRVARGAALPRAGRSERRAGHPPDHHAARAGHGVHGRWIRAGQRRRGHGIDGAGAGPAQRVGGHQHGVLGVIAGAGGIGPNRTRPDRRGPGHPARGERPAGLHPAHHQVRAADDDRRGSARGSARGVPAADHGTPASGRDRDAAGNHGRAGHGQPDRGRGLPSPGRIRRAGGGGGAHPGRSAASADLGRRRRHIVRGFGGVGTAGGATCRRR